MFMKRFETWSSYYENDTKERYAFQSFIHLRCSMFEGHVLLYGIIVNLNGFLNKRFSFLFE